LAEPEGSPKKVFGNMLRFYRTIRGMTQEDLGERVHCTGSAIGKIETGVNAPTEDFCKLCDEVLGAEGALNELREQLKNGLNERAFPEWFAKYPDAEAQATIIRTYEPLVIPGLLQTEDYARALLRGVQAGASEAYIEEQVMLRLGRQEILDKDIPPHVWALIDEGVLHREIGSAKLMHDQLLHVARLCDRPRISVQIIPFSARERTGLLGAFALAEHGKGVTLYLETATTGQVAEVPSLVTDTGLIFDTLRCEALPRVPSHDLIMKVAEERWTTT
jgi:transcriptional regulator with XRE-family HTH domain